MGSTLSVSWVSFGKRSSKESEEEVRIKSESHRPLHVICKDPRGGDKIKVLPVRHISQVASVNEIKISATNEDTYRLQIIKDRGHWPFGKMRLAVVWKTIIMDPVYNGLKVYKTKEFYIDPQNPQGYQLNEVTIKDGPVENTFRLRLHYAGKDGEEAYTDIPAMFGMGSEIHEEDLLGIPRKYYVKID